MNKFPKGLDGRSRDRDGEIRHKRSDTKLETIRDTYTYSRLGFRIS